MTIVGRRALLAASLAAVVGCSHTTSPQPQFVQGDALVTRSPECLTLLLSGTTYQPSGLPESLAVVGLRLRVAGRVRTDAISICELPMLELTSVVRE